MPTSEIKESMLQGYFDSFFNRSNAYYEQWRNGEKFGLKAVRKPVSLQLIASHLSGEITLSIPALSAESQCKWCCWDSDAESGDLDNVQALLQVHGWEAIRESKRPGRDGHLWLFFDKPVPAADLIRFAKEFQRHAGVSSAVVEFFPKQASAEIGSAVRGSLGIHRKPDAGNCRGWFDAPVEQTVCSQLTWFLGQKANSAELFRQHSIELQNRERARQLANKPSRGASQRYAIGSERYSRTPILELVEARLAGSQYVAQCPLCAAAGNDRHRDNPHISLDGTKFCCWFGGAGKIHKGKDIVRALHAARR